MILSARQSSLQPLILLLLTAAACSGGVFRANTTTITRSVAPGILYTQEITTGDAPQVVNILRINLKAHGVTIKAGQALDRVSLDGPYKGREALHSLADRNGALAAVNADFFPFTGDPLGLCIRDGEMLSEPRPNRACLGFSGYEIGMEVLAPNGYLIFGANPPINLDGMNRIPAANESVILTPSFSAQIPLPRPLRVAIVNWVRLPLHNTDRLSGTITETRSLTVGDRLPACPDKGVILACGSGVPESTVGSMAVGETVEFGFSLAVNEPGAVTGRYPVPELKARAPFSLTWLNVTQGVGGGPFLVKDGKVWIDGDAEGFDKADFVNSRHARTAAGVTAAGELLLVTVDGRSKWSLGMTLPELSNLMLRLGAVRAINLDGGGSTTMVVGGSVVNAPSDGMERPIADSLMVYGEQPETHRDQIEVGMPFPEGVTLHAGDSYKLLVHPRDGGASPVENDILWGTEDGFGFISQQGVFTAIRPGDGKIHVHYHGQDITVPVHVLPAEQTARPAAAVQISR